MARFLWNDTPAITSSYTLVFGDAGVCTYCGEPADNLDHVIPLSFLESARRKRRKGSYPGVKTFACGQCNRSLGSRHFESFSERLAFANKGIRKRYAKELSAPAWAEEDLEELGPSLRKWIGLMDCRTQVAKWRVGWIHSLRLWEIVDDVRALTSETDSPRYRAFLHRYFAKQIRYEDEFEIWT